MIASIIQADKVSKTYHTGGAEIRALSDISLVILPGDFIMITGRNGSGKSTLLHQLALLDFPDSGEVIINNQKTTELSEQLRMDFRLSSLGYIFQEYALIAELTAIENVMLPAMMLESSEKAKKKAAQLLDKVGLTNKHNRLPSELSGGEQQKVAIARALVNSPRIIFADEPTANLDTIAAKEVLNIFKTLNEKDGITIVMVTHEPEELEYASRLIHLSDGRIK
ncbi:MAG: ABC transporter ATP-binding protein [Candidatus Berkelbacteria bacterium]